MSGRSPAYVPTMSSRRRSTSIVALTVASSRSTSHPSADGWAEAPSYGASVVPISQWSGHGHEEDDLAGHPDGQAVPVRDPLARHDEMRAAARQDAQRAAAEGVIGLGRPDAGRVHDGPRLDLELRRRHEVLRLDGLERAVARRRPQAGRLHARDGQPAIRDGGPGHGQGVARVVLDAVVVEQPASQSLVAQRRARSRACPPSTAVCASPRPGGRRGRRTSSGRCRRTPSRGTGSRRSGRATAPGARDAARGGGSASAPPAPRGPARTGTARGIAARRG